ncbi:MAG: 3-dehydroquinate synthase [Deltaproteobacteria bacterium]|nr:3-dehydroquinate synthase [Deltaproteobacteria bacterium]
MKEVRVTYPAGQYTALVGHALFSEEPGPLSDVCVGKKVALITDAGIPQRHLDVVHSAVGALAKSTYTEFLDQGENQKQMATVLHLAERLLTRGFDRSDIIIGLGGGSVLDIAGFLSAIYMRGLLYVNIPTTLLAQCDACIGGKVGVNFGGGKNLLGAFYHPATVLVDTLFLHSLPIHEQKAGLVEVIKAGIIGDPKLFSLIEQSLDDLVGLKNPQLLQESIYRALQVKAQIVEQDEKEAGPRMKLNLGHTVGHAVEAVFGPQAIIAHGEAVAVGIRVAAMIAWKRGLLPEQDLHRIDSLITSLGFGDQWKAFNTASIMEKIALDKKKRQGRINFVLPLRIGEVTVVNDICEDELTKSLEALKDHGIQHIQQP